MNLVKSTETKQNYSNSKHLARIAGVYYLCVGIFGGFAEGFADPKLYVTGDIQATATNILANQTLVRLSVISHLLDAVFFLMTAIALYSLLKHVNALIAKLMLIFVTLAAGIISLNAVFQFEALRVSIGTVDLSALGNEGSKALAFMLLDMQHYGTLAAQVFFGLWLVPLGYLTYKSNWFPKFLSALLLVAGGCYLIDLFAAFAFANYSESLSSLITIPCAVAEIWMVIYLLVIGIKKSKNE